MTDDTRSHAAEDDAGDWLEDFDPAARSGSDLPPTLSAVPPGALGSELIRIERAESAARLVVGGLTVLAGVVLFGLGFTGLVAWGFEGLELDPELQTSAAGLLVALIGLLVIGLARPRIRITPPDVDGTQR